MTGVRLAVASLVLVLACAGLPACASRSGGSQSRGTVTVLGSWTGTEKDQFQQALDAFTDRTGIEVNYTGTRALSQVLLADVQKGTPPDVAVLPSPGEIARYVHDGALRKLDDVVGPEWTDQYAPQWRQLAAAGNGELYAIPVRVSLKSIVWFNPARTPTAGPRTWEDLKALEKSIMDRGGNPWCLGMTATATSGWPGTDWVEDILLHQSGVDAYQRWVAGVLPWQSPEVQRAWRTWGEIVTGPGRVRGGTAGALLTDFGDAARPMFTDPPGCSLEHQGSFSVGAYQGYRPSLRPGVDFDFFPFPDLGAPPGQRTWEVSADMAGMFNDTPEARALIRFLASEEAQGIWPKAGAFSANSRIRADAYDNPVSRKIGEVVTGTATLCFDASDLMPATMRDAFQRAVLEYLADPARLDEILRDLEGIRSGLRDEPWSKVSCGQ